MKGTPRKYILILIACIAVSYFQHIRHIRTDIQGIHAMRQSQTMWNIRNFTRNDANILNPRINVIRDGEIYIQRYEFPLMQWGIAMVQRVFGERIEIVRTIVFLIGAFCVTGMFFLVYRMFGHWLTALLTAVLFQYSPVFFYYTINPLPDVLALCSGIWYLYFIVRYFHSGKVRDVTWAGVFLLIATLAKLPFLMFAIVSVVHFITRLFRDKGPGRDSMRFASLHILLLLPAVAWYAWVMPSWEGNPILYGVFRNSFSRERYLDILNYHATTMFPDILLSAPAWLPILIGLYCLVTNKFRTAWVCGLVGITFLYLFLELNSIGKVHDYYMLPFLPWLYLVVGMGLEWLRKMHPLLKYVLIAICIWSAIHTRDATRRLWSIEESYFNPDVFLYSEELKKAVPDDEPCIILNDNTIYIFSYRIDKMGHVFRDDSLPIEWVDDMVRNRDVRYMYSDSEKLNNDPDLVRYIDEVVMTKGSIRVFRLKVPEPGAE